ncbi:MAG: mercury transporter MerT [Robiginitomaculum sp.]|nr:MAG: mercury transporter MerT [Robiginitomaculum sp.]
MSSSDNMNKAPPKNTNKLLATGGILGAILASSCCIVPLILISLGVSGAWIGSLTALEPYKPLFIGITSLFLAAGFWHVYFKKPEPCEDGSYCARPSSSLITKTALWIATFVVLLALTTDYWAPLFY